jgi:hypothetical protein
MAFPAFDLAPMWNCIQQSQVEDIEIRAYDIERHLPNGYIIYRGGVEAILGVTRIVTDTLIVRDAPEGAEPVDVKDGDQIYRLANHEARAIGAIKIVDPDGTIQASDLWVTWAKNLPKDAPTARAKSFKVEIGKFLMNAEEATRRGTSWDLSNVRATTDKSSRPIYSLSMDRLLIEPGRQGTGKGVAISLLGTKLPKIPSMAFSLDRRARATRIPQLSYRQRDGFGVAWDGNFLSGDQSLVTTSISSFPRLPPTFVTTFSTSRIPYEKSIQNQFQTQSDLGERNPFSFFGNIYMADIEAQNSFQSAPRDTFQVATTFNVGTFGRRSDLREVYSKPIEVLQEKTGQRDGYTFATQLRAGLFQEGGDKPVGRGLISGAISPAYKQSGRMISSLRLDGGVRMDAGRYSWFGGEVGLSYEPRENTRLSVGVYGYRSFGRPLYDADLFNSDQGISLRGDIFGNATKISMLWRYDPSQGWFDRQFRISQVMGPIEPVIIYRQNPNEYQFGLRFRMDQVLGLLLNRSGGRNTKPTKIRP